MYAEQSTMLGVNLCCFLVSKMVLRKKILKLLGVVNRKYYKYQNTMKGIECLYTTLLTEYLK